MNSRRSCKLRKPADRSFHVVLRNHHKIGKLVHNNHDLRHKVHHSFLFRAPGLLMLQNKSVVSLDVTNPCIRKGTIPCFHLRNAPVESRCRLLRIGHHRNQKMRNAVIDRKLHHLRVNHDEFDLVRPGMEQNAHDDGIDADRLTGAGGAGNQNMRHLCDVSVDRLSGNVLTDGKCKP